MANAHPPPVLIAQGIGHLARTFLREVGSVFWFIMNTFEETFERNQALLDRGPLTARFSAFLKIGRCESGRRKILGVDDHQFPTLLFVQ